MMVVVDVMIIVIEMVMIMIDMIVIVCDSCKRRSRNFRMCHNIERPCLVCMAAGQNVHRLSRWRDECVGASACVRTCA